MLYINNASTPYSEQRVSLGGNLFTLVFKFNVRNQSWYIDLKDSSGETALLNGIKLCPNQNLTGRYILEEDLGGNLWCLRVKNDLSDISLDNLGADKTYRLAWISNEEEQEVNLDGVIQF